MSIIYIKNLFKTFDKIQAVNNISFSIEKSQCFGFLGPNGSGKTTTLRMLYGSVIPDKNPETEMSVLGFDPRISPLNIKARIGIVPQENTLDEEFNVYQNLSIYARFYHIPEPAARKRIYNLLEFMELGEKAETEVRTLSGGMKRRLVIARALLNQPEILILDEPTTGLDPQVRQVIWQKIRSLMNSGVTTLLTTHYMEEAQQIATYIHIMDKGKTILTGEPQNLTKEHMESHVLTIRNRNAHSIAIPANMRTEEHGDTILVYSNEPGKLQSLVNNIPPYFFSMRESTLEDLFLKITGRALNE